MSTLAPTAPFAHLSRSAKLLLPRRLPDQLRRQRLLDFLHHHSQRQLFLVSAAAGYGKSTLIADFAHDTEYALAWLRLDQTDRDLANLLSYLVAALQKAFPNFESVLPSLGLSNHSPEALASILAREMESLDDYFLLMLDDFHLVEASAAVMRFFDALILTLPEHAHLLVAGRTIPALSLARMAARQQVSGLSEENLGFTPQEVRELLALRQRSISLAEAEQLVTNTGGWITGILLTTQVVWDGLMANLVKTSRGVKPLYDYLIAEVLDQQPPPLRQFLLESAVLPEMEPVVCDAVLERTDSATLLEQAEARRLFISAVGEEFRSYQYHHLFQEFLLAQLHTHAPARLQTVRGRAADWYAAHAMPEAAVTFYMAAGQATAAAAVIEAHARAMSNAGKLATLRQWADQMQTQAWATPKLFLFLAKTETDMGQLSAAEGHLRQAAEGFGRQADVQGQVEVDIQRCWMLYRQGAFDASQQLAQTTVEQARAIQQPVSTAIALRNLSQCQLALGQMDVAEAALQEALQLFKQFGSQFDVANTFNDLAALWRVRGQLARAAQAQQHALTIWREIRAAVSMGMALNNVGFDFHLLGQYQIAMETYAEALEWARRSGNTQVEMVILMGQVDILIDVGDLPEATALCQHVLARVDSVSDWTLTAYVYRTLARLDRWAKHWVSAQEWLRRAQAVSGGNLSNSPLGNLESQYGMLLVEMGQMAQGRQVLEAACQRLQAMGALSDLAQAFFLRAMAEFRAGEPEQAAASLQQTFQLVDQIGYDQMLVSEARHAQALLEAAQHWPAVAERIAGLRHRLDTLTGHPPVSLSKQDGTLSASAPAIVLQVRAFGQGQVWVNGQEIARSGWVAQRSREVFFFLVDQMPVARETLMATFWPDKPTARASANLRQTLYRMRRALGVDFFSITGEYMCELLPNVTLEYDVAQFEAELQQGRALPVGAGRRVSQLATALRRYSGVYLADLPAEWTVARREELSALWLKGLDMYAHDLMHLSRYAEAREVLLRALDFDPLQDNIHGSLLRCLGQMGRRHEMIDHYRRYRELLRKELGLDPPPEISSLYAHLIG